MLVLTRKPEERIRIGEDIVVTIVRTQGRQVRLGIEAPAEIAIERLGPVDEAEEPLPEPPASLLPLRHATMNCDAWISEFVCS